MDEARLESVAISRAASTVHRHLRPTPILLGDLTPELPPVVLKLETFQPTGSFKVRGALNALSAIPRERRVVTASAGNHALGMAYAARVLKRDVTVVVAENASAAKVAALNDYPVHVVRVGQSFDEAEEHARALARGGAEYVSAYNHRNVVAGNGTVGLEVRSQIDGDLTIVCAVGGGGLAAGVGLWASDYPGIAVVGVEASASRAVSAAVASGKVVPVKVEQTIADGLAGNIEEASLTVDLIRDHVREVVAVTEEELADGIRFLVTRYGLVAEGAGAAAFAAVLAGKVDVAGRAVVVVSGRNIALSTLAGVLARD